jgi:hypothetical protein
MVNMAKADTKLVGEASDKTKTGTVSKETAIIPWENHDESKTDHEGKDKDAEI